MKKLSALLLALCLLLTGLCGCKKAEEPTPSNPNDNPSKIVIDEKADEKAATQVAEDFFDAALSLEIKDASKYTDDPDAFMEKAPFESASDLFDTLSETIPAELAPFADNLTPVMEEIMEIFLDEVSYEILSTEKDGDDYLVTVEATIPVTDDINFEDYLDETEFQNMAMELLANGTISEDMTQDQLMEALIPAIMDKIIDIIRDIDIPTKTEETTITVVKVDDEWLVSSEEFDSAESMLSGLTKLPALDSVF